MLQIFKTIDDKLLKIQDFEDGCWINLVNPSETEIAEICDKLRVDCDYIKAALDEEERSRIESDNGCILILVDIPMKDQENIYNTIPLGIVLVGGYIITVCLKESPIIHDFIENRVKNFWTFKRTRFILQMLFKVSTYYLNYLKQIDKTSNVIENELHKSMKNKELIQLLALGKSLVYFSTSLKANEIVMEKMLRLEYIKKYPEDTELLEDVIIENKQAIEMCSIYSNILSGTMDAFASVISNNLNIVMKFLASITIIMSIPTIISSFFGMNVAVPLQENPIAFTIILGITVCLCGVSAYVMLKKKMF